MPKNPLINSNHLPYHVTNRTIDQGPFPIELSDVWNLIQESLRESSCKHPIEIISFVLMSNHYHMILITPERNLEEFIRLFKQKVEEKISEDQSSPEIEIDDSIKLSTITPKLNRVLKQFAPFGPENTIPTFQSNKLVDTGNARPVGQKHLKLSVIHLDIRHLPFSCIGFGLSNYYEEIRHGEDFDIAFHIDENEWNGKTSLQLNIKDIKLSNKQ